MGENDFKGCQLYIGDKPVSIAQSSKLEIEGDKISKPTDWSGALSWTMTCESELTSAWMEIENKYIREYRKMCMDLVVNTLKRMLSAFDCDKVFTTIDECQEYMKEKDLSLAYCDGYMLTPKYKSEDKETDTCTFEGGIDPHLIGLLEDKNDKITTFAGETLTKEEFGKRAIVTNFKD